MKNIGIVLAAGNSTRFDSPIPKQLYFLNGKPIIQHSVDLLSKYLDDIYIVTNSVCAEVLTGNIIINDIDSRIDSISSGLKCIESCDNILIHDAARPFINDVMVEDLLKSQTKNLHSQFYLPLINGLAQKTDSGFNIPNRDDFIELCTPQITDFDLFKSIFEDYIKKGRECEVLPLVSKFHLPFNLIKGHLKHLRKITTLEDIF